MKKFSYPNGFTLSEVMIRDENKIDLCYKVFCMDVDGIPKDATMTDCINECPFGFGIRADGKIMPGARADEWINKSIQKED